MSTLILSNRHEVIEREQGSSGSNVLISLYKDILVFCESMRVVPPFWPGTIRQAARTMTSLVCAAQMIQAQSEKAVLVEAVAPVYPLVAAYSSTGGQVKVKLVIDRSGTVTAANLVEGHKLLAAAAVEAARKWRFTASSVESEATIVFSFRILPKGASDSDLAARFRPPFEMEVRRIIPEATTNSDPAADPPKLKSK